MTELVYKPIPQTDYARVTFAADIVGDDAAALALCSSIVHTKIENWSEAWCPGEVVSRDVLPDVDRNTELGTTKVSICVVAPMSAIRDCEQECCLG